MDDDKYGQASVAFVIISPPSCFCGRVAKPNVMPYVDTIFGHHRRVQHLCSILRPHFYAAYIDRIFRAILAFIQLSGHRRCEQQFLALNA